MINATEVIGFATCLNSYSAALISPGTSHTWITRWNQPACAITSFLVRQRG